MTEPYKRTTTWPVDDRLRLVLAVVLALSAVVLTVSTGAQLFEALSRREVPLRATGPAALAELTPGTCVETFRWREGVRSEYAITSCNEPHGAELVAKIDGTDAFDAFPGTTASSDFAEAVCDSIVKYAVNLRDELPERYPNFGMRKVYPTALSWGTGTPFVYCFVVNTDGKPLVGQYYTADTFE